MTGAKFGAARFVSCVVRTRCLAVDSWMALIWVLAWVAKEEMMAWDKDALA